MMRLRQLNNITPIKLKSSDVSIGILGKSGAGKSSVAAILKSNYGFKGVPIYTTRPMRNGDKQGDEYYFLNDKTFQEMSANGEFVETRVYHTIHGDWYYGSCRDDYTDNSIAVLSAEMYESLSNVKKLDLFTIYIDVDENSLRNKLLERGDNPLEIDRRLVSDANRLNYALVNNLNLMIINDHYQYSPQEIAVIINEEYQKYRNLHS